MIDFEADLPTVKDSDLAKVAALANRQVVLEQREDDLEKELKEVKEKLFRLSTEELPLTMDEIGLSEFTLKDGKKISIKPKVRGSLPSRDKNPEKFRKAIQWFVDNGHDGLIKREISIKLQRDQSELADNIIEVIKIFGVPIDDDPTIHAQTLQAWAREMLGNHQDFPAEDLGIWIGRETKITT